MDALAAADLDSSVAVAVLVVVVAAVVVVVAAVMVRTPSGSDHSVEAHSIVAVVVAAATAAVVAELPPFAQRGFDAVADSDVAGDVPKASKANLVAVVNRWKGAP